MKINYVNLTKQYKFERKNLIKEIDNTFLSGSYVGGDQISKFERSIAKICSCKYAVAMNSGTDALTIALHLLGVGRGDEVITPPNSFIASTAVIIHLGAKPVFVDVKDDQNIDENLIEKKITNKTKAIMPVHLTGRMCNMKKIIDISKKYKIPVVEDCAQSIMSRFKNRSSGSWGEIGCFSAHPLKNLNAMGDGGYLVTNNKNYFSKAKSLINHGMENRDDVSNFGFVSRMDNIQATILNYRLKNLKKIIKKRRNNYQIYLNNLNRNVVFFPKEKKDEFNTYHTFVIQVDKRDKLKKFLDKQGIGTSIHYPKPIHLQKAYLKICKKKESYDNTEYQAKRIISLPINQFLKKKEILFICKTINNFFN
jgi:dTDP-4-amino-4,6-dideoxygalactose transaminase